MDTKTSPELDRKMAGVQWQKFIRQSLGYISKPSLLAGMMWSLAGLSGARAQLLDPPIPEELRPETFYASSFLIEALSKLSHVQTLDSKRSNSLNSSNASLSPSVATTKVTTTTSFSISSILDRGREISINGSKFPVAWLQWQQGDGIRTAISDIGAMNALGMELLSTDNPSSQPVRWFAFDRHKPIALDAHWLSPHRYLDITDFAQIVGWQFQTASNTLSIDSSLAKIENIREENLSGKKQIVIELDRPAFWQLSQTKKESVISFKSSATPALEPLTASIVKEEAREEEGTLEESASLSSSDTTSLYNLAHSDGKTKLTVNHPVGKGVRVVSLAEPDRLVIDIKPDALVERDIFWAPGINWRQRFVELNAFDSLLRKRFPVVWLEIDPRSSEFYLKPITSKLNNLEGTSPLADTARNQQAIAAINGGFFNRNNQLPLGAIRQYGRWLSGPILNRGAIGWNLSGDFQIGHLSLQETLVTHTGERLSVLALNSGYVQRGVARYTKEWGKTYTPLIDNETISIVQFDRIVRQIPGGKAKEHSFAIPESGYLLTIRGDKEAIEMLSPDTRVSLKSATDPNRFTGYPHILGAGPLLLQNGQIVLDAEKEKFSSAFNRQAAIRSAIATTKQGHLIVAAVHETSNGMGATLKELAEIMQHLQAVDALNLDGGSSTSLYLGGQLIDRSPVTAARVHNGIGIFRKDR